MREKNTNRKRKSQRFGAIDPASILIRARAERQRARDDIAEIHAHADRIRRAVHAARIVR